MTQELSQQVGAQAQLAALQLQTTLDQTSAPEITRKVEQKTTENVGLKRENMDLSMKKWWNSSTDQKNMINGMKGDKPNTILPPIFGGFL